MQKLLMSRETYHNHRQNASELLAKEFTTPSDAFAEPRRYTLVNVAEVSSEMLTQEMIREIVAFQQVPGDTAFGKDF